MLNMRPTPVYLITICAEAELTLSLKNIRRHSAIKLRLVYRHNLAVAYGASGKKSISRWFEVKLPHYLAYLIAGCAPIDKYTSAAHHSAAAEQSVACEQDPVLSDRYPHQLIIVDVGVIQRVIAEHPQPLRQFSEHCIR